MPLNWIMASTGARTGSTSTPLIDRTAAKHRMSACGNASWRRWNVARNVEPRMITSSTIDVEAATISRLSTSMLS